MLGIGGVMVVIAVALVVALVVLVLTGPIFMKYNNKNIYLLVVASFLQRNLREG